MIENKIRNKISELKGVTRDYAVSFARNEDQKDKVSFDMAEYAIAQLQCLLED